MAKQKNKKWSDYLWLVSATYFILGFFNIVFAWLGVICFLIPLLMAIFGGGKGYCNNYCGRGQLFLQIYNPQNEMFSHFGTKRYNFKNETQLFKVIPHTSKNQKKSTGFAGTKYI